jgi:hypothetical protein
MRNSATWFFDHAIFPALDWLQIEALRGPCTRLSSIVRTQTGLWFHPATWEVMGVLLTVLGVLLVIRKRSRATRSQPAIP